MISEHKSVSPQVCYHCGSFNPVLLNEEDGKMVFRCNKCGKVWIKIVSERHGERKNPYFY